MTADRNRAAETRPRPLRTTVVAFVATAVAMLSHSAATGGPPFA